MTDAALEARRLLISGRVQGVGFRHWVEQTAARQGLRGFVRNLTDGRVEAVIAGDPAAVAEMARLCHRGPSGARVDRIDESTLSPDVTAALAEGAGFRRAPTAAPDT